MNEEAEALYRRETTRPKHSHAKADSDIVTISKPKRSNARNYTLERLKRDRPMVSGSSSSFKRGLDGHDSDDA